MLIGSLARRAGVSPQAVRYYERLGLLSPAERTAAGYRRYGQTALEELTFIRNAQHVGFSLDEIKQVLDLGRSGTAPCSTVLALAEGHLVALDRQIQELMRLRDRLARAVSGWKDGGVPADCASSLCGMLRGTPESGHPGTSRLPALPLAAKRR